jgi:hypothetical protein
MSIQSFETTNVLILVLAFGSLKEKWHLDVARGKEGNGASFQKLWVV